MSNNTLNVGNTTSNITWSSTPSSYSTSLTLKDTGTSTALSGNLVYNGGVTYIDGDYVNGDTWYDNTYRYYRTWPWPTTTNVTYQYNPITITSTPIDVRSQLKTLDDKIVYIIELAGFKKEEVKIKYFNPDKDAKGESAYIEYTAESETHPLKGEKDKTYKATFKQVLNTKKLNFDTAKVSYSEGLIVIEVDFEETSKVKQLQLPA